MSQIIRQKTQPDPRPRVANKTARAMAGQEPVAHCKARVHSRRGGGMQQAVTPKSQSRGHPEPEGWSQACQSDTSCNGAHQVWSHVKSGGFPAMLGPLFLHGGQVTSQCHSPEEHHAGRPARPQSSAPPLTGLQVPQGGLQEGGSTGRGLHSSETFKEELPWAGRSCGPKLCRAQKNKINTREMTTVLPQV